jgi:hypothetical protein
LGSIAMYAPKATPARDASSKRVPIAVRIRLTLLYYRRASPFKNVLPLLVRINGPDLLGCCPSAGSSRAGRLS